MYRTITIVTSVILLTEQRQPHTLSKGPEFIDDIKLDFQTTPISAKLRTLLNIAEHVRQNGKKVTDGDIQVARNEGATDREIHDTVMIAAAFSMYNRYVDGLGTWAPAEKRSIYAYGRETGEEGYLSF